MLVEYGNTTVSLDWKLDEDKPTGFSRIYYVVSGRVTYEADGKSIMLRPGCLYALPSSRPYNVWRDTSIDFTCTYLHVIFPQAHINGIIEREVPEGGSLYYFLKALKQSMYEGNNDLLNALADDISLFLNGDPAFVSSSSMVAAVREYILRHISEPVQLKDLSSLFSYHPNYFIKLFYKETGITPHQFEIQIRMQYASLLLSRGMSSQDVGCACGYTDVSTFTRAFRKYYGVTPFKYKHGSRRP